MNPAEITNQISPDVFRFLMEDVDTVPELEALLLFRDDPLRDWSCETLAERLYVSVRAATAVIGKLERQRWIEPAGEGRYRFSHAAPEAELIDRVSRAYAKHLSLVARIIHEKPGVALREFAKAFKVRREE